MSLRNLIVAIASSISLLGSTAAQQTQSRPVETGLALEVTYLKGAPPAYQPVPWSQARNRGSWYGRFGRTANWQLPPGALPIDAVRIVSYLEGDVVSLSISVLRGVTFHDAEDKVATYTAHENEGLIIEGLKSFGVEPFEIKVVRVTPTVPNPPSTVNKTKSVDIVGIEPVISTLPVYRVTLHNLAARNISALKANVLKNGKVQIGSMRQGREGEPLITGEGYWTFDEPLATRAQLTPGGYSPSLSPDQQIVIASLVFEDGTYEGEAEPAAMYRAFVVGRKIELKRVVPLLASALSASDIDSAVAAVKLRSQLTSLSYDIDEAQFADLAAAFPTLNKQPLRGSVEVAIHAMRKDLMDELQPFQNGQVSGPNDFRLWLIATRVRYSNWLSRLRGEAVSQQ